MMLRKRKNNLLTHYILEEIRNVNRSSHLVLCLWTKWNQSPTHHQSLIELMQLRKPRTSSTTVGLPYDRNFKVQISARIFVTNGPSILFFWQLPCVWTKIKSCALEAALFWVSGNRPPCFVGNFQSKTKDLPPIGIWDFSGNFCRSSTLRLKKILYNF